MVENINILTARNACTIGRFGGRLLACALYNDQIAKAVTDKDRLIRESPV